METYMTICKIDSQREFSVWLRKLKQGFCINLEGWGGREMGGRWEGGSKGRRYMCTSKNKLEKKKNPCCNLGSPGSRI